MINGLIENIYVRKQIRQFKDRGILVYENENTRFYEVSKKFNYEDNTKSVINDYNSKFVGSKADILVTSRNPLPDSILVGLISRFLWIGHAGVVIDNEGKQTIEITGNDRSNYYVSKYENTWLTDSIDLTNELIILRVKNMDQKKADQVVNYLESKIGYPYNYSFLFNRHHSYYCTDLVSRAVETTGIKVNYDYLLTTGADLIVSKNTYIVYYRERIVEKDQVKYNVYYLSKEGS